MAKTDEKQHISSKTIKRNKYDKKAMTIFEKSRNFNKNLDNS